MVVEEGKVRRVQLRVTRLPVQIHWILQGFSDAVEKWHSVPLFQKVGKMFNLKVALKIMGPPWLRLELCFQFDTFASEEYWLGITTEDRYVWFKCIVKIACKNSEPDPCQQLHDNENSEINRDLRIATVNELRTIANKREYLMFIERFYAL
ncbi:hypothetical protein HZH68_015195 [Vespula germanica]|uniref:Uncharacterized protein n=1 Tax=Vespula germanica TaxID=30212 RepID=A0A834J7E9_VESGE|nr:hypothetical protein HZH68_015195 [Vespula germanica]